MYNTKFPIVLLLDGVGRGRNMRIRSAIRVCKMDRSKESAGRIVEKQRELSFFRGLLRHLTFIQPNNGGQFRLSFLDFIVSYPYASNFCA